MYGSWLLIVAGAVAALAIVFALALSAWAPIIAAAIALAIALAIASGLASRRSGQVGHERATAARERAETPHVRSGRGGAPVSGEGGPGRADPLGLRSAPGRRRRRAR